MLSFLLWGCEPHPPTVIAGCNALSGDALAACELSRLNDASPAGDYQAACASMTPGAIRDHCYVAYAVNTREPALCDEVGSELWRSECHFDFVDGEMQRASPVATVQACVERVPHFMAACLKHARDGWLAPFMGEGSTTWFRHEELDEQLAAVLVDLPNVARADFAPLASAMLILDDPGGGLARCKALFRGAASCEDKLRGPNGAPLPTQALRWPPSETGERWW